MDIKQVLEVSCFASAKVIAGHRGLHHQVSGVMILEATDIENWGKEGEIIVSSYFALKDLNETELKEFFQKLNEIKISALVIKLDRLITDIPDTTIKLCDEYDIPLIRLPKEVKYETVILQILGPLINQNVTLLNQHYHVHNQLTQLALKGSSIHTILHELKKLISCDVSFFNQTKKQEYSSSSYYNQFELLDSTLIAPTQFMNYQYYNRSVRYLHIGTNSVFQQISVKIPNPQQDDCELILHTQAHEITKDDFMAIETVASFLQLELVKQHSISQQIFHMTNNIVDDLLNGRIYDPDDIQARLQQIRMDKSPHFQVMMIKLYPEDENLLENPDWAADLFTWLKNALKQKWFNIAFLEKQDRITFLNNFSRNEELFTKKLMSELLQKLHTLPDFPAFHAQTAISTTGDSTNIPRLNQEILDIQKILHMYHQPDNIYTYDDLGIYKLFLSSDMKHLETFVPPAILDFQKEYPELMKTLACFLDHNQNYSETAQALFLHPKTVRYRISQIRSKLSFDFDDPEQILTAQIASRLFRLMH